MIFDYILIAKINERGKELRHSRYRIFNYNKSVQRMAILFRKNSAYNWDRVLLSEFEILYYNKNAESHANRMNGNVSNV
jgi:hypothetical protein